MEEKIRLDILLIKKELAKSRELAKEIICTGNVFCNGKCAKKPSEKYLYDTLIEVKSNVLKYVSRGGLKLEKAIEMYNIDLTDCICMDIGASTGGFTDCMLQNGAKKVYAVDVGYNQLDKKLLNDIRVINLEHTNIRYLKENDIKDKIDFFSVDVSFISLNLVLPNVKKFLHDNSYGLLLVKPQFEAGKSNVGKKGVVKDIKVHINVLKGVYDFIIKLGCSVINATFSPIKGPEGNIEYLYYIKNSQNESIDFNAIIKMAENSHLNFSKER
ncbi:MAG: TlyA family RNA methyltransferase [Oscillospiraceae bacterium]